MDALLSIHYKTNALVNMQTKLEKWIFGALISTKQTGIVNRETLGQIFKKIIIPVRLWCIYDEQTHRCHSWNDIVKVSKT